MTLTSLSTADFSGIEKTVTSIINDPECSGQVSVSLPSLRVDAFTVGLAAEIQKVRRTGLTFAPEGGTWRMRQVINKLIREEDLYAAVDSPSPRAGRRVKLYFLIGLPTETDEDVLGIAALAKACVEIGRRYHRNVTVTASVGGFVPKAHTPFQWFGQNTMAELRRKVNLLKDAARATRGLTLRWHDPEATTVEGLVSRGDRRMGRGHRERLAGRRDLPGVVRALRPGPVDRRPGRAGLTFDDAVYRHRRRGRGPALGPRLGRAAPGLPVAGLAGGAGRARPGGLPLDALLRLRRLHRPRGRARGGLVGGARRGQPGHGPGPGQRWAGPGAVPAHRRPSAGGPAGRHGAGGGP